MNALMARSSLFDDFFRDFPSTYLVRPLQGEARQAQIRLDVKDEGSAIVINADLPGVKKEDIHVHVQDSMVTLGATLSPREGEAAQGKVLHSERYAGTLSRSLSLPYEVDESRSSTGLGHGGPHLGLPGHPLQRLLQPRLHRRAQTRGRSQAKPGEHLIARNAGLLHGGHLRQGRAALRRSHRQRLELAALDQTQGRGQVVKHHLHLTGHQGSQSGGRSPIRDMGHEDPGLAFVELGAQVQGRALSIRGVIELAGPGLGLSRQLGHRLDRGRRADHQHIGHPAQQSQRRNLLRLVGQLGIQGRADGQRW